MIAMAQVIKEYATALFDLAQETDSVQEISDALDTVGAIFEENPEYVDFLSSPNIPKSERIAAIEQAFKGNAPDYVVSFLSLFCERGRIRSLEECISEYKQLCDAANKISVADVSSAVELTEAQQSALKKKLEKICGNAVVLNCQVDSTLLGGMVVYVDGKVIDGSIKHKLHELKEVMHQ